MMRTCFFCHKPLPIEQRGTVFCSVRCQELEAQLQASSSGRTLPSRPAPDDAAPFGSLRPDPKRPSGPLTPAESHPRGSR